MSGGEGSADLFEHLKQWRRRKAADMEVPAFVVFGDRDLASVAEAAPSDLLALSACRGVGPTKLKQYGEELLAEVARFKEAKPQPEAKVDRSQLLARAAALFRAGQSPAAIALELSRSESTVWQYFLDSISADQTDGWKDAVRNIISRDAYREITAAMKAEPDTRLKPIFERLAGRYSYEQIRVARAVMDKQEAIKGAT